MNSLVSPGRDVFIANSLSGTQGDDDKNLTEQQRVSPKVAYPKKLNYRFSFESREGVTGQSEG